MARAADRTHAMELRREAGASAQEIAEEFGVSPTRVRQILKNLEHRRAVEQREMHPTSLAVLEMAGKLRRQLRLALEDVGITDLTQLQGRRRSEVRVLRGISTKSLAIIETVMREAGLIPLEEGRPRQVAD